MNYITHLNEVLERFNRDFRLNPKHVSLYMALFRQWNRERFPTWIYIKRRDIMNASRIGSTSTYHRVIRDLNKWKYVNYRPSFLQNPGSRVKLLRLGNKGIPLEVQLSPKSSSLVGRPHPIGEQLTIYNKHINFKEFLCEKNEVLDIAFQKQNLDLNERIGFLYWLNQKFEDSEIENSDPFKLVSIWLQETSNDFVASHSKDNLHVANEKRYDQPL